MDIPTESSRAPMSTFITILRVVEVLIPSMRMVSIIITIIIKSNSNLLDNPKNKSKGRSEKIKAEVVIRDRTRGMSRRRQNNEPIMHGIKVQVIIVDIAIKDGHLIEVVMLVRSTMAMTMIIITTMTITNREGMGEVGTMIIMMIITVNRIQVIGIKMSRRRSIDLIIMDLQICRGGGKLGGKPFQVITMRITAMPGHKCGKQ